jgi:hypothetical protein
VFLMVGATGIDLCPPSGLRFESGYFRCETHCLTTDASLQPVHHTGTDPRYKWVPIGAKVSEVVCWSHIRGTNH